MAEFYHIYINPKKGITKEKIQEKMDLALHWYRYNRNVYIVYTTSDVDKWKARLEDLVKTDGTLFICKLDVSDRNGWMVPGFWDWIKERED